MPGFEEVLSELKRRGILLQQDKTLPSVTTILAGEPIRGSWWSHPKSHQIFGVLSRLTDHPDVLPTRLIGGKVTYVDRSLWPDFLAVATSGEPWQLAGLSAEALRLLRTAERGVAARAKGDPARDLQRRLLVYAGEIHTESGRHEVVLQSWPSWAEGKEVRATSGTAGAKERLEAVAAQIGASAELLPWRRFGR